MSLEVRKEMEEPRPLNELVPDWVVDKLNGIPVTESGWAAGPSYVVRKTMTYETPASTAEAMEWLERYRHIMRACHLRYKNGYVLWMYPNQFLRLDRDDTELCDSKPGVSVTTAGGSARIVAELKADGREEG